MPRLTLVNILFSTDVEQEESSDDETNTDFSDVDNAEENKLCSIIEKVSFRYLILYFTQIM